MNEDGWFAGDAPLELVEDYLRGTATWPLGTESAPRHVGLAVSGGGDSVAMLWLVAPWAKAQGRSVSVATVDHGLRPESADEAAFVAGLCREIGVRHDTLRWTGWDGRGNFQARAREARRGLLAEWARGRGVDAVLLAHTQDDQAETFLLRLARGSGVDGLSGMAPDRTEDGLRWLRPLLNLPRTMLRDYLRLAGRPWIDDPSNDDLRFDRVKARRALDALKPLGLEAEDLAQAAWRLSMASGALRWQAEHEAERLASVGGGEVRFPLDDLAGLPSETQLRLAASAIQWVSTTPYRPRLVALRTALGEAVRGRRRTLQGAMIVGRRTSGEARRSNVIVITREPRAAARAAPVPTTALWDGRWRLSGPHAPDLEVRMLGEGGLGLCPDWRDAGCERTSLLASPAVWRGSELVAAPVASRPEGWVAETVPGYHDVLKGAR